MSRKPQTTTTGTPAIRVLESENVLHGVHPYEHDPDADSYGLEAAESLGVDPTRVFKTLCVDVDDSMWMAIVPVSGSLDLKAVARAAGGKKAHMASIPDAERATGYVVGGISPLGGRKRLPAIVDSSAFDHDLVYVSGGRRGLDISLAPADLVHLTNASTAPIGKDS